MKSKRKKLTPEEVTGSFIDLAKTLDFSKGKELMAEVYRVECENGTAYKIGSLTFWNGRGCWKGYVLLKNLKPVKSCLQERMLLSVLLNYPLRYSPRKVMMNKVWRKDYVAKVDCNARLNVTISRLKDSLKAVDSSIHILCSRTEGYMLYVEHDSEDSRDRLDEVVLTQE